MISSGLLFPIDELSTVYTGWYGFVPNVDSGAEVVICGVVSLRGAFFIL